MDKINTDKKIQASHNSFSIFKGTIFERSHVSFRKWLYAIHMVINAKKSVSTCQVSREIGGDYRTAWRMMHKIREAMANNNSTKELFKSIVEINETYVGGKLTRRHPGITDNKTPIVGAFDRDTGHIKASVLLGTDNKARKVSQGRLLDFIDSTVDKTAPHMADVDTDIKLIMWIGNERGFW